MGGAIAPRCLPWGHGEPPRVQFLVGSRGSAHDPQRSRWHKITVTDGRYLDQDRAWARDYDRRDRQIPESGCTVPRPDMRTKNIGGTSSTAAAWLVKHHHQNRLSSIWIWTIHTVLVMATPLYGCPVPSPALANNLSTVPQDLDLAKFDRMFIDLMTRPTPGAHSAAGGKVKSRESRIFICQ